MRAVPRSKVTTAVAAAVLAAGVLSACTGPTTPGTPSTAPSATVTPPETCVYSAHSIAELDQFAALVGHPVDCALVFNDQAPDWQQWASPWFIDHEDPDKSWAEWAAAAPGRQLVITQGMFPTSEDGSDWLARGSAGAFRSQAQELARNLVAAGLGSSYIRLGNEANGTWYPYSVPDDADGQRQWRQFWATTVDAMRKVPGAHFRFVWCVNYAVRDLALEDFYPGDQYVDVVALDAYDRGTSATDRFAAALQREGGIDDVTGFAAAHGKPLAFPEWGLWPTGEDAGGGADPDFITGMGRVFARGNVAFQGYWYGHAPTVSLLRDCAACVDALRTVTAAGR